MEASADYYRRFAMFEAHGVSEIYEDWAIGVAEDPDVQALIETLPRLKWQANLIFASARWNGAPLVEYSSFRLWLIEHWTYVALTAMARFTQTNEAGRCALLLPILSQVPGPLALIEVGASAGLCLFPDRYSYEYATPVGSVRIDPIDGASPVVLRCDVTGRVELPAVLPTVSWRAGVDLTPIDLSSSDSLDWLETLIWPEHDMRRTRLRAAAGVVVEDPPLLVAGDLNEEIERLASLAPSNATLVVFHSAVLAYLDLEARKRFIRTVSSLDAVWVSNEGTQVLPDITAKLPPEVDARNSFVLARNGEPLALAGAHGQYYRALS